MNNINLVSTIVQNVDLIDDINVLKNILYVFKFDDISAIMLILKILYDKGIYKGYFVPRSKLLGLSDREINALLIENIIPKKGKLKVQDATNAIIKFITENAPLYDEFDLNKSGENINTMILIVFIIIPAQIHLFLVLNLKIKILVKLG